MDDYDYKQVKNQWKFIKEKIAKCENKTIDKCITEIDNFLVNLPNCLLEIVNEEKDTNGVFTYNINENANKKYTTCEGIVKYLMREHSSHISWLKVIIIDDFKIIDEFNIIQGKIAYFEPTQHKPKLSEKQVDYAVVNEYGNYREWSIYLKKGN